MTIQNECSDANSSDRISLDRDLNYNFRSKVIFLSSVGTTSDRFLSFSLHSTTNVVVALFLLVLGFLWLLEPVSTDCFIRCTCALHKLIIYLSMVS